jgi:hypothetical protein
MHSASHYILANPKLSSNFGLAIHISHNSGGRKSIFWIRPHRLCNAKVLVLVVVVPESASP